MNNQNLASISSGEVQGKDMQSIIKNQDYDFKSPNSHHEYDGFPIDIFPKQIQELIQDANCKLKLPRDFLATGILFASSVLIGNSTIIEFKPGYTQKAILYLAIVGRPGVSKTPSLSFILKPLIDIDTKNFKEYEVAIKMYNAENRKTTMSKKQKNSFEPDKPILNQLLVKDFTSEALAMVMKTNEKGIGVFSDELATWYKNLNRYHKGSDEQLWLSNWSGEPLVINRATKEALRIPQPFVSVCGGIQPEILKDMAANRLDNGFMDRLLFIYPENLRKEKLDIEDTEPINLDAWESICNFLYEIKTESQKLLFNNEAKKIAFTWQHKNTDSVNETNIDLVKGVHSKMESHFLRFVLILHMLKCACNKASTMEIDEETTMAGIKLSEYFIEESKKIYEIVAKLDPMDSMDVLHRKIYVSLPTEFESNNAKILWLENGLKERSFFIWLGKKNLFKKLSQGKYMKLL
jgi:hypothetical protein